MKKHLVLLLSVATAGNAQARSWDINIENGASFARILPLGQSTPRSNTVRYGFGKPGLYLSPSVSLVVSEHSKFNFGYQFSENNLGVQLLVNGSRSNMETEYDIVDMHNISGGYYYNTTALREKIGVGFFVKMGIAYGHMSGYGGSGSANGFSSGPELVSVAGESLSGFEVIPDFWTPNNTLGLTISSNSRSKLGDRLALNISTTINWRDPYKEYSRMHYTIETTASKNEGIVQYKGVPMQLQVGLSYKLFRFGN